MSAAHPWLEELPWPTDKMPRDQLYERIEHTLTMVNMGVLATTGKNGAIASPIEFYAEGLTAYMYPQPGSPKIKAMQSDPRVSFAVHTPVVGWVSCRGAQLFGQAEILEPVPAQLGTVIVSCSNNPRAPARDGLAPTGMQAAKSPTIVIELRDRMIQARYCFPVLRRT